MRHIIASRAPEAKADYQRLVDVAQLCVGYNLFQRVISNDPTIAEEKASDIASLESLAKSAYLSVQDSVDLILFETFRPFLEEYGKIRQFERKFVRATMGGDRSRRMVIQGELFGETFSFIATRDAARKLLFPTRSKAFREALKIGEAYQTEPKSGLHILSAEVLCKIARIRKWLKEAAELFGVAPLPIEALMTDVASVNLVAEELQNVNQQLDAVDPISETAADLADRKAELLEEVQAFASQSKQPHVVLASAVQQASRKYQSTTSETAGLSPKQEEAMMSRGRALIAAGAGSGKTRVLSAKVVYTIKELGADPNSVIATSFSNDSSIELNSRIGSLYGPGSEFLSDWKTRNQYLTTHKLGGMLVRMFGPKDDVDTTGQKAAKAEVIVGGDQSILMDLAMVQVTMGPSQTPAPYNPNETFFPVVGQHATGLKDELFLDIQRVFDANRDYYYWLEDKKGKGAGKYLERSLDFMYDILDRRQLPRGGAIPWIARLVDQAKEYKDYMFYPGYFRDTYGPLFPGVNIPAFQPGQKYGAENKGDQKYWDKSQATYKSTPANQWFNLGFGNRDSDPETGVTYKVEIPDHHDQLMGRKRFSSIISKMKGQLSTPGKAMGLADAADPTFMSEFVDPRWESYKDDDKMMRKLKQTGRVLAAVYGAYEWLKGNEPHYQGRNDHDDTLINASKMMVEEPVSLRKIRTRFKHIFVDEAQDLNPAQHLMFGLVAGYIDPVTQKPYVDENGKPTGQMTADTYCFIGDDKQAIYEFRGAVPEEFINKSDLVPDSEGFKTLILETNYRSGEAIVDAANKLIAHQKAHQIPMVCDVKAENKGLGEIEVVATEDHTEAAGLCAEQIAAMTSGDDPECNYENCGIAMRTNAEITAYITQLAIKGIPFYCASQTLFNDHTSKALVRWMTLAAADESDTTTINDIILHAYDVPAQGIGRAFQTNLPREAQYEGYTSYLQFLRDGKKVYKTDAQNANVQGYLRAIEQVLALGKKNLSPAELIEEIMKIPGAKGDSVLASLKKKITDDPNMMDQLVEETELGKVSDEQIEAAALSPVQALLSVVGQRDDINSALDYIKELKEANDPKKSKEERVKQNVVYVGTVHGWKGLEKDRVYTSMAQGIFPSKHSLVTDKALRSERRLAYVAITRAAERLVIMEPAKSVWGTQTAPSQFVEEACIPRFVQGTPMAPPMPEPVDPDPDFEKMAAWDELYEEYYGK